MKSTLFSEKLKLMETHTGYMPYGEIEKISRRFVNGQKEMDIKKVYGPFKVEYVEDVRDTYRFAVSSSIANQGKANEFKMNDINIQELGLAKVKHWKYENEWRYKITPVVI